VYQKLVSHNEDIDRLVAKGYAVDFDSSYLLVRDIPYLDHTGELQLGAFITKLEFIDPTHVRQDDHQVWFTGSPPYQLDGSPITNLSDRTATLGLSTAASDLIVQRQFSNKPYNQGMLTGFANFFDKIESYAAIICGPAIEKFGRTPYTHRTPQSASEDTIFKLSDTLTSRAEIVGLSARLREDVVAVIGLGGTGAYLLDYLVKTPVKEIRGFDFDEFHVHNAFRSPGKLDEAEFNQKKAAIYQARYEGFRHGLTLKSIMIDASTGAELDGVTFAFVCVDKGSSRAAIFDLLMARGIPFIDVGMGLNRKSDGPLRGMVRTTYYSAENAAQVRAKNLSELSDRPDDLYRTNIQIGELNALNAALAVIRFKQLRGFYTDTLDPYHMLFDVSDLAIVREAKLDEA
jgi:hypothetical protein